MKTKVLMVYPEIPETFWSFTESLKFVGKKANFPPLSLLTVAALLPERYEPRIVDMNVRRLARADILASDIVFVSAMLVQKDSLERVVRLCKELGKRVVAGGPYPTSSWESIAGVDHFVLGEAETTLPPFLEDLEAGRAGPVYRSDLKPDLSLSPRPRYDLIDPRPYSAMVLQYSRGCPFDCEFCEIIELFGRKPRVKSPSQFLGEIEALYLTGFRGDIFIVDDNFIGNKAGVKSMLRLLVEWQASRRHPFRFYTEASVDLAKDDELLDLMARSGFTMAFVGIETPVEESLAAAHKGQNLGRSLADSVRRIQGAGIEVKGGFIVGFDSDPLDIADRQIDFIQETGIATAMVGLLTALPNTQLYRRLQAENRISGDSTGNNTHALELNFVPAMGKDRLLEAYVKVMTRIYAPKEYFARCMTLLRNLPRGSAVNPSFADLRSALMNGRAFILSLLRQSLSAYGLQYLRFLRAVLRELPWMFPKAIELAIYGHGFFKLTRVQVEEKWAIAREGDRLSGLALEWIRSRLSPAPGARQARAEARALRARLVSIARRFKRRPRDAEMCRSIPELAAAAVEFAKRPPLGARRVPVAPGPEGSAYARLLEACEFLDRVPGQ